MSESNQTKWVGVRPVNPEESIPVKQGTAANLKAQVEPITGAEFEVIQATAADLQATVTPAAGAEFEVIQAVAADLQATVTPAAGAEFTVTQTDLAKLYVGKAQVYGYYNGGATWEPLFVDSEGKVKLSEPHNVQQTSRDTLKTASYKPTPAIGDLQAIEDVVQESKNDSNTSAGTTTLTFSAVPTGKVWVVTNLWGYAWTGTPADILIRTQVGGTVVEQNVVTSPGNRVPIHINNPIVMKAGDQASIVFYGMAAGDAIYARLSGYQVDQY